MFVFIIFKKSNLEIIQVYFDEEDCIRDYDCIKYESSDYDWRALNLSHYLNRCIQAENELNK